MGTAPSMLTAVQAMDAAFAGERCDMVLEDGTSRLLDPGRWESAAAGDLSLFVDPCRGATLDLGCGPGRLSAALRARGIRALGIDFSAEAVRRARLRGATALHLDIFADIPETGQWEHVLLADGNIGIGGCPQRLLARVAELLSADGTALVELGRPDSTAVHENVTLHVGGRISETFSWATVGVDAIHDLAVSVGLAVDRVRTSSGRHVATIRHDHADPVVELAG